MRAVPGLLPVQGQTQACLARPWYTPRQCLKCLIWAGSASAPTPHAAATPAAAAAAAAPTAVPAPIPPAAAGSAQVTAEGEASPELLGTTTYSPCCLSGAPLSHRWVPGTPPASPQAGGCHTGPSTLPLPSLLPGIRPQALLRVGEAHRELMRAPSDSPSENLSYSPSPSPSPSPAPASAPAPVTAPVTVTGRVTFTQSEAQAQAQAQALAQAQAQVQAQAQALALAQGQTQPSAQSQMKPQPPSLSQCPLAWCPSPQTPHNTRRAGNRRGAQCWRAHTPRAHRAHRAGHDLPKGPFENQRCTSPSTHGPTHSAPGREHHTQGPPGDSGCALRHSHCCYWCYSASWQWQWYGSEGPLYR